MKNTKEISYYRNYYRNKVRINIQHSFGEDIHYHTLEIVLYINNCNEKFQKFEDVESILSDYFRQYENKYLNKFEKFQENLPTIEYIGYIFFIELTGICQKNGIKLLKLEIGENPSRIYTVTNFLITGEIKSDTSNDERELNRYIQNNIEKVRNIYKNKLVEKESINEKNIIQDESKKDIKPESEIIEENLLNLCENKDVQQYEYVEDKTINDTIQRRKNKLSFIACIYTTIMFSLFGIYVYLIGALPKGTDIYLYLGKAKFLYYQLTKHHFSPIYMKEWYNGYLIFMKNAPVSYYLLALVQFITKGDIFLSYIVLIVIMSCVSSYGWIRFGRLCGNIFAGMFFGILWIFIPESLRNLTQVGNLQFLVAMSFIPYLLSLVYECIENINRILIIKITFVMWLIVLTDVETAIITLLSIIVIYIGHSIINKKQVTLMKVLIACVMSFGFSMTWLYEAIVNGDVLRFDNTRNGFYFDIILLLIVICSGFIVEKKSRYYLIASVALMTASMYLNTKFAIMAYASFFIVYITWNQCKRRLVSLVLGVMGVQLLFSWNQISDGVNEVKPINEKIEEQAANKGIKQAVDYTKNRLLVLGLENESSLSAYYAVNCSKEILFTYSLDNHATTVTSNIQQLKYALYTKHFSYIFDRSLELGCDTILIQTQSMRVSDNDIENLKEAADKFDYQLMSEKENQYIFKKQVETQFGTVTNYEGIAIGKTAKTIAIAFPYFEEAKDIYLDDYSFEELSKYKKIYLSGFQYRNLLNAQDLVRKLSENGTTVLIDMDSIPTDVLTNRQKFLGVTAQTVSFQKQFPTLLFLGEAIKTKNFIQENEEWNTIYLENLDKVDGYTKMGDKVLAFSGTKDNDNIRFISFNLLYHTIETNDENTQNIFNQLTGLSKEQCPIREVKEIKEIYEKKLIKIYSDYDNVNSTLGYLEAFQSDETIRCQNNLLVVNKGETVIRFDDKNMRIGLYITIMQTIILSVCLKIYLGKRRMYHEK